MLKKKVNKYETHFCLVDQNCAEYKKDVQKFLLAANFSPNPYAIFSFSLSTLSL